MFSEVSTVEEPILVHLACTGIEKILSNYQSNHESFNREDMLNFVSGCKWISGLMIDINPSDSCNTSIDIFKYVCNNGFNTDTNLLDRTWIVKKHKIEEFAILIMSIMYTRNCIDQFLFRSIIKLLSWNINYQNLNKNISDIEISNKTWTKIFLEILKMTDSNIHDEQTKTTDSYVHDGLRKTSTCVNVRDEQTKTSVNVRDGHTETSTCINVLGGHTETSTCINVIDSHTETSVVVLDGHTETGVLDGHNETCVLDGQMEASFSHTQIDGNISCSQSETNVYYEETENSICSTEIENSTYFKKKVNSTSYKKKANRASFKELKNTTSSKEKESSKCHEIESSEYNEIDIKYDIHNIINYIILVMILNNNKIKSPWIKLLKYYHKIWLVLVL